MLGIDAHLEAIDDFHRCRVDHVDIVRLDVGNVDAGQRTSDGRAQLAGAGFAVQVVWIGYRRHAGDSHDSFGSRGGRYIAGGGE